MQSELTIVMYHYVRELEETRYPAIRGLRTSEFRHQLNYLRSNFNLVTMAEVVHAGRSGDSLPPNAALLSFDDGYLDHFTNVFPLLFDAKVEGSFFPPACAVVDRVLLDVNRIHYALAVAPASSIALRIDEAVAAEPGLKSVADYRSEWAKPNRFDDAETIYVKRMLQTALPLAFRNDLTKRIFAEFVSSDEVAFSSELYGTVDQFRLMQSCGMYIGSHGDTHCWLNSVSREVQETEVDRSLQFLRDVGSPVDDFWVMCYPYGAWNESMLSVLRERNCSLGLTTEVATARIGGNEPLTLPRYDTNDFPKA